MDFESSIIFFQDVGFFKKSATRDKSSLDPGKNSSRGELSC